MQITKIRMFKTYAGLPEFVRVSAKLPPAGGLRLPASKLVGILADFGEKSTKKRKNSHRGRRGHRGSLRKRGTRPAWCSRRTLLQKRAFLRTDPPCPLGRSGNAPFFGPAGSEGYERFLKLTERGYGRGVGVKR